MQHVRHGLQGSDVNTHMQKLILNYPLYFNTVHNKPVIGYVADIVQDGQEGITAKHSNTAQNCTIEWCFRCRSHHRCFHSPTSRHSTEGWSFFKLSGFDLRNLVTYLHFWGIYAHNQRPLWWEDCRSHHQSRNSHLEFREVGYDLWVENDLWRNREANWFERRGDIPRYDRLG